MQRPIWRLGAALAIALGIVAACGGGDKPPAAEAELLLTATPRQINDQGQASQIDITATTAEGTAGSGTVTLTAVAGALGNSTSSETVTLTNGKAADVVLGQAGSFASATAGTGAGAFRHPSFIGSNGNQLFVADSENSRVLVWNTLPVTNLAADLVLGQNDFTHGTANDDNQDGFDDTVPSARTLAEPSGVTVLDNALIVGDYANRRYLVYR